MWYAGACVSWRLTAVNSYKETTVIQYIASNNIVHNRPVETVTGDAFELIKNAISSWFFKQNRERFAKFVDLLFTGEASGYEPA